MSTRNGAVSTRRSAGVAAVAAIGPESTDTEALR